eukprot:CAMPEP_0113324986 /NCGR_PEP_ID=MMETSP0010_2-20120614/17424_1 /TAXON_ID=216773 ORGANISM="Corethron hystrix, Strain 308" /NCGR_SAMPLE_ID=MMETSP0010_2 /ASSEMBLY_ACC=CAM_ASM_000155 /LENGTH=41 /DNA_ID=CAMNT_0000184575 /DNA_START=62 /DNA_END=184 /DNA_ORIENTATION=+ /assembly_acc=CAM_ASM_000155
MSLTSFPLDVTLHILQYCDGLSLSTFGLATVLPKASASDPA